MIAMLGNFQGGKGDGKGQKLKPSQMFTAEEFLTGVPYALTPQAIEKLQKRKSEGGSDYAPEMSGALARAILQAGAEGMPSWALTFAGGFHHVKQQAEKR